MENSNQNNHNDKVQRTKSTMGIKVPLSKCTSFQQKLQDHLLNDANVPNIVKENENIFSDRILLLEPSITKSLNELSQDLQQFIQEQKVEIKEVDLDNYIKKSQTLEKDLQDLLPVSINQHIQQQNLQKFKILDLDEDQNAYAIQIAQLMLKHKSSISSIDTILQRKSKITKHCKFGTKFFQKYQYLYLLGSTNTQIEFEENGCLFKLDLLQYYYDNSIQQERNRVLEFFNKDDVICDLFGELLLDIQICAKNIGYVIVNTIKKKELYEQNIKLNHVNIYINPNRLQFVNALSTKQFLEQCFSQLWGEKKDKKISHIFIGRIMQNLTYINGFVGCFNQFKNIHEEYFKNQQETSLKLHFYLLIPLQIIQQQNYKEYIIAQLNNDLTEKLGKETQHIFQLRDIYQAKIMGYNFEGQKVMQVSIALNKEILLFKNSIIDEIMSEQKYTNQQLIEKQQQVHCRDLENEIQSSKNQDRENLDDIKKKMNKLLQLINQIPQQEGDSSANNKNSQKENAKVQLLNQLQGELEKISNEYQQSFKQQCKSYQQTIENLFQEAKQKLELKNNLLEYQKKKKESRFFKEKVFRQKDSFLTKLFQNQHIKTIYNIICASATYILVYHIVYEYQTKKEIFDHKTFKQAFNDPYQVAKSCLILFFYTFFSLFFVKSIHFFKIPISYAIPLLFSYYYGFIQLGVMLCNQNKLKFGSSCIVCCEMVRYLMKAHSYIRNKLLYANGQNQYQQFKPECFNNQKNGQIKVELYQPPIKIGSFQNEVKNFTYFLFAPTLLYRDKYPTSMKRNIGFIGWNFLNFFICIYLAFLLYSQFIKNQQQFAQRQLSFYDYISLILKCILPATAWFFLLFFALLHCWMNAFAELLKFGDRRFYEDWWNSTSFGMFYRKWNLVVQEWLFQYIYCDLVRFSLGKINKFQTFLITFLLSALIHEIIMTQMMGYFFPLLFIIFAGPGILLANQTTKFAEKKFMNIIFWQLIFLGQGLLVGLYFREFHARQVISNEYVFQKYGYILGSIIPRCFIFSSI